MPTWLSAYLVPDAQSTLWLHKTMEEQVKVIMDAGPNAHLDEKHHPTIFYELLFNSDLPKHELTLDRMAHEGTLLIVAGSETVGNAITTMHYHLLANPEKLAKVRQELVEVMPNADTVPTLAQLRRLPYLSACVDEALRLSSGTAHRLARIAPKQGLKFHDWVIPAGAAVSMSMFRTHYDGRYFKQPKEFLPERWLAPDSKDIRKYLVPFSPKGPRQCLGMELAYAELFLATAVIQRRFDTEIFETDRDDIDPLYDFFVAAPKLGSQGMRIMIN